MTDQGTNTVIDHENARAFLPAGPFMAGRPLPAMNHHLDADGAVSPARAAAPAEKARQRLDRVPAEAFPATLAPEHLAPVAHRAAGSAIAQHRANPPIAELWPL